DWSSDVCSSDLGANRPARASSTVGLNANGGTLPCVSQLVSVKVASRCGWGAAPICATAPPGSLATRSTPVRSSAAQKSSTTAARPLRGKSWPGPARVPPGTGRGHGGDDVAPQQPAGAHAVHEQRGAARADIHVADRPGLRVGDVTVALVLRQVHSCLHPVVRIQDRPWHTALMPCCHRAFTSSTAPAGASMPRGGYRPAGGGAGCSRGWSAATLVGDAAP